MVIHHQTIIVARVRRRPHEIECKDLEGFLSDLVRVIDMRALFEPIAINGTYGFTGIVGIVTSHIAFHYFDSDQSLHFDVYSCKEYDLQVLVKFIDEFWGVEEADILFLERDKGPRLDRYSYVDSKLVKEYQE